MPSIERAQLEAAAILAPVWRAPDNVRAMPMRPFQPPHPATVAQPKRLPHSAQVHFENSPYLAAEQRRYAPHAAASRTRSAEMTLQRFSISTSEKSAMRSARVAPFLVEDSEVPGEGQVKKSQFLAELRNRVTAAAARILDSAGQSSRYCPYIPYWFGYYEAKKAEHVEQAIHRYAPAASSATSWQEYVALVTERVRVAFEANVATGSLEGVPPGLPLDLEARTIAQRKSAAMAIQRRPGKKAPEVDLVSLEIDRGLREQGERLNRWREIVPLTQKREIVFRKLSRIERFDPGFDERRRPITRLNFEQNEAHEGISLTRNPDFVADVTKKGSKKGVYACALPKGGAYDLEAAYLKYVRDTERGLPGEYVEGVSSRLSKEVTAESVPRGCIIGWAIRIDGTVTYHPNPEIDPRIDYKGLDTYDRFERWLEILGEAECDLSALQ